MNLMHHRAEADDGVGADEVARANDSAGADVLVGQWTDFGRTMGGWGGQGVAEVDRRAGWEDRTRGADEREREVEERKYKEDVGAREWT